MGDRPLINYAGSAGGAESSHSLVDLGQPPYPLSKAPSYHSDDYHRRQMTSPPPIPDQYGYDQRPISPSMGYQLTFNQPEDHNRSQPEDHYHPSDQAVDAGRQGSARPESQWDIGNYYNYHQQTEIGDSDWQPGQLWQAR